MPTPTPRTDAVAEQWRRTINFPDSPIPADFARELERELRALQSVPDEPLSPIIKDTPRVNRVLRKVKVWDPIQNRDCEAHMCFSDVPRQLERELEQRDRALDQLNRELADVHRWIEGNNQDGVIDSATYRSQLDTILEREIGKRERAERELAEAKARVERMREALERIAGAGGFDNIGNWARNTAREALNQSIG